MSSSSEIHVFVVYTEIAFKNLFTLRPFSKTYKNTKDGPFLVMIKSSFGGLLKKSRVKSPTKANTDHHNGDSMVTLLFSIKL